MKTYLICGGAGFMGSNFTRLLLKERKDVRVITLDAFTYAGNADNLKGLPASRHTLIKGDIADTKLVAKLMKESDYVINFAAETHVDRSIHGHSSDFFQTNVLGVASLLEALRQSPNVKKMVQISTDEVWGDLPTTSKDRFDADSPLLPNSPYSASKASGDLLARSYFKTYGVPVVISRSVNNFGPRQYPEKLIPFFVMKASKGEKLPLYGKGTNVRDWIHVDDHSRAVLAILEKGKPGEVYPISSNDEHSNIDIAKNILKILKKKQSLLSFVSDRPGHDRRYSVDSSKTRKLGWKLKHSLDSELSKTIAWYRTNGAWLKSALKRSSAVNSHLTKKTQ
jgi:dTDP-glucose 4,6-dehydratase